MRENDSGSFTENPRADLVLDREQEHADAMNLLHADSVRGEEDGATDGAKLKSMLQRDLVAADLRWSLFVAASQSYRYDSVLRPFPPAYVQASGERDIDQLRATLSAVPPLPEVVDMLESQEWACVNSDLFKLMSWVMCGNESGPQLKSVPKEEFQEILAKVKSVAHIPVPTHILSVDWSSLSSINTRWRSLKSGRDIIYAFHGSRLENFHSILNYGLQQHMNKNSLFGKGIYLSSELGVCMVYSPTGCGWDGSLLGNKLSCVALCEVIDHPDVKCQTKDMDRSRAITTDSMAGQVPEKYFVVVNNDLVRLKYILVFSHGKSNVVSREAVMQPSWFSQHKFLLAIVGYVLMLVAIGLSNSSSFRLLMRRIIKNSFKS